MIGKYGSLALALLFLVAAAGAGDAPVLGIRDAHFFFIGLVFLVITVDTLLNEKTWSRLGSGLERSKNPFLYWIITVMGGFLTILAFFVAFFHTP